jgi:pimeloyl-ACP methyl ester carboxylesterase
VSTYVLIHGAGTDGWFWHRVTPELRALGHEVVAPDLPCSDDSAGLAEYADTVVEAIGGRSDLILVAQSMGGFTAPLVCQRVPVRLLVLLAAMVPKPGESPGDWWVNTGHAAARRENARREGRGSAMFDLMTDFFHDVPPDVVEAAMRHGARDQCATPFEKPWPLSAWPAVPTRFLLCRQDRFFPADFLRRIVKERLGITPEEMDGGHLVPLSRPHELVTRLEQYRQELQA